MKLAWCDPNDPTKGQLVLQGNLTNAVVSRDGSQVAFSKFSKWYISPIGTPSEAAKGFANFTDNGDSDWSHDGKHIAFGSSQSNSPGVWLIDAQSGKRRLLVADILAKPRWSPDGKTIAAGLLTSNEIVLLDLSSLDLKKAFASE